MALILLLLSYHYLSNLFIYLGPWSGLFCCPKPFFNDVSHSFFFELQPWEVFENFRYFLQTKDSMLNRYPLLSGREYLELSLPMHANLGLIHVILILNIWLFILIIWSFLLIIWLQDKIKQISISSGNLISTLGNHFVTPNKVLDITNNQMLMSNIWILRTNNGSNNQIFISIIFIIRPRLALVGSNWLSNGAIE